MSDFSVRLVASANLIRFVRFVALWCSRTFEMLPLITVFQREREREREIAYCEIRRTAGLVLS